MIRLVLLFTVVLSGCSAALDPVKADSAAGVLDLSNWNFVSQGPAVPQDWLWDAKLWSPLEGRPTDLPPSQNLGPPDQGGLFAQSLMRPYTNGIPLAGATARIRVLMPKGGNCGLQIGALPGAFRVWVNNVVVWESGVVSLDPHMFVPNGAGTILTVQPQDGVLDIVVQIVSRDPLIRHPEVNRLWVIGPAAPMMEADSWEKNWRFLQATVLAMGIAIFLWISRLRPERRALVFFAWFLASCLLKLLVNVEQPEPLLGGVLPGVPLSLYLLLNHGLNLLPFPLMALFLVRQFPQDLKMPAFWVITAAAAAATVWELLPFVVLAGGWEPAYTQIMHAQWSFFLNLYVILATLFLFERFYHVFAQKRPLSRALFIGAVIMALIVLLPVPLSYFVPVKFTYFLGWGMFLFLLILGFALVRLQIRASEEEVRSLTRQLKRRETLSRFISPEWAARLGRDDVESLRPGDRRTAEAILVRIWAPPPREDWLLSAGRAAASWNAVFSGWDDDSGIWVLEALSETALSFALAAYRSLNTQARIVLTRAEVEFRIVDIGNCWQPALTGIPSRLAELAARAEHWGSSLVLDSVLKDGLVVGGWRRHRHLSPAGTEIELYEYDETADLKDATLEVWETGLGYARDGKTSEAAACIRDVLSKNPRDRTAAAILAGWESSGKRQS